MLTLKYVVLSVFCVLLISDVLHASARQRLEAKKRTLQAQLGAARMVQGKAGHPQIFNEVLYCNPAGVQEQLEAGADVDYVAPNGVSLYKLAEQALKRATQKNMAQAIFNAQLVLQILEQWGAKDANSANAAKMNDQKKASPKSKEDKKKKNKSQAPAAGAATEAVAAESSEKHAKSAERDDEPNQASASAAAHSSQEAAALQAAKEKSSRDKKNSHEEDQEDQLIQGYLAKVGAAVASVGNDMNSANAQKAKKIAKEVTNEIFHSIVRVACGVHLHNLVRKEISSQVIRNASTNNLLRNFERFFITVKKHRMSFEDSLICMKIVNGIKIFQIIAEALSEMSSTHKSLCATMKHEEYGRRVLKKLYNNCAESGNDSLNKMDLLIDNACDVVGEKVGREVMILLNIAKALENDEEMANVAVAEVKAMKEGYDYLNSSFDDFMHFNEDLAKNNVERMQSLVSSFDNFELAINDLAPHNVAKYSPLFYGVLSGRVDFVDFLLSKGKANPNLRDAIGRIPLLLAWDPKVRSLLISAGASVDFQDGQGRTALMTACEAGDSLVVKELLKAKANFKLIDRDGRTAYALAHQSVKNLLDECGAGEYELKLQVQMKTDHDSKLKCAEDEKRQKEVAAQIVKDKELKAQKKKAKKLELRKLRDELAEVQKAEIAADRERENAKEAERLARQKDNKRKQVAQIVNSFGARAQTRMKAAAFNKMRTYAKNAQQEEAQLKMKEEATRKKAQAAEQEKRAAEKQTADLARLTNSNPYKMEDLNCRFKAFNNAILVMQRMGDLNTPMKARAHINLWDCGQRFVAFFTEQGLNADQAQTVIVHNNEYLKSFDVMHELLREPHVRSNTAGLVKFFAKKELSQKGTRNKYAEIDSLLFDAVRSGDITRVEQMSRNRSVDCLDKRGCSPFFYASLNGFSDIAVSLVKKGANAELYNKKIGVHPALVASDRKTLDLIRAQQRMKISLRDSNFSGASQKEKEEHLNARLAKSLAARGLGLPAAGSAATSAAAGK